MTAGRACWVCEQAVAPLDGRGVCVACAPYVCAECDGELEWVMCEQCEGLGDIDEYDADPVNHIPEEDFMPCSPCDGRGGWDLCPTCCPAAFGP